MPYGRFGVGIALVHALWSELWACGGGGGHDTRISLRTIPDEIVAWYQNGIHSMCTYGGVDSVETAGMPFPPGVTLQPLMPCAVLLFVHLPRLADFTPIHDSKGRHPLFIRSFSGLPPALCGHSRHLQSDSFLFLSGGSRLGGKHTQKDIRHSTPSSHDKSIPR